MAFRFSYSLVLMGIGASALWAQDDGQVAASPQRPSFSVNTTTTTKGWLEFEGGATFEDKSSATPVLFKIGATENLELFFGLTPIVDSGKDFEDLTVGSRWRFTGDGQSPSLGAQVAVTTFRSNFAAEIDYSFLFILSHSIHGVGIDLNGGLNLPDSGDEQVFGILTLSKAVNSKFGVYGEVFAENSNDMLVGSIGCSFSATPRFVLDGAFNFNISNSDLDKQFLIGATTTLARIWK
ncbi:MAG: hypothetical protein ACE5G1_11550 [bacterium]